MFFMPIHSLRLLLLSPVLSALADEILYEDNFTNLDPSWGTPSERLSVKDGKLTLKPASNTTESILNQSNVFDDADIRVDVIVPAGDPNVPGGLIFWARDHSNFYCLCIDAAGYFKISRYVTDRWLQPVGWLENEAINKGIGQVNKLRVVTKGRQATAYINDKQVTKFDGQPPQGGGCVGVSGGSPENAQNTWQFANLRVTDRPADECSTLVGRCPTLVARCSTLVGRRSTLVSRCSTLASLCRSSQGPFSA